MAKSVLPDGMVRWVSAYRKKIRLGDLNRTTPVSRAFGYSRGQPIDRIYIEQFLAEHARDVRGRVLEIADNAYTLQFGGDRVTQSDVLHLLPDHPEATIVDDLAVGAHLPTEAFDCVICTQTLMFIYDVRAAAKTLYRILKPGGVALVTVAGISQICRWDMDQWGDYWRFTSLSLLKLFSEFFPREAMSVQSYGNVLTAVGFLHGLAADEFTPDALSKHDRDYELVVSLRAEKPQG